MRRWIVLLVCLLLPAIAQAQPKHAIYDMELSLHYRAMTGKQQAVFDRIYDAVYEGAARVFLPSGISRDEANMICSTIVNDAPELCMLDTSWSVWKKSDGSDDISSVTLDYGLPFDSQKELLASARAFLAYVPEDEGNWRKAVILHDLICERVDYMNTEHESNAYGALVEGRATCGGYAKAYTLLLRLIGVPCSMVIGKSIPAQTEDTQEAADEETTGHAWSMVDLAGQTVLTDVTWDDRPDGEITHWYFALPERWMGVDHQADPDELLPPCTTMAWSWEIMNGGYVVEGQGEAMVTEKLRNLLISGKPQDLRFESEEEFAKILRKMSGLVMASCAWEEPEGQMSGKITWYVNARQKCLHLAYAPGTDAAAHTAR